MLCGLPGLFPDRPLFDKLKWAVLFVGTARSFSLYWSKSGPGKSIFRFRAAE